MGCSASLSKMILFILNIGFFLVGIASLAVGIWVAVNKNELFRFINLLDGVGNWLANGGGSNKEQINAVADQNGLVTLIGLVLIGIGAFTLLVGFCGCYGAVKASRCLLKLYALLVALVLIAQVTAAIMAAVFQGRIRSTADNNMLALQEKFYVALPDMIAKRATENNGTVTTLLNYVQMTFDCCGAKTLGDISKSRSWLTSNRIWGSQQLQLPVTCCRVHPHMKLSAAAPGFDWVANFNATLADPSCPFGIVGNSGMNRMTCYSGILEFLSKFAWSLIGIIVSITVFELFCIVIACSLFQAIGPSD